MGDVRGCMWSVFAASESVTIHEWPSTNLVLVEHSKLAATVQLKY
jgi:hypothetical protein